MSERITIKSQREIELMRAAGAVVRDTLLLLEKSAAIGMTTEELNKIAESMVNLFRADADSDVHVAYGTIVGERTGGARHPGRL